MFGIRSCVGNKCFLNCAGWNLDCVMFLARVGHMSGLDGGRYLRECFLRFGFLALEGVLL